MARSKRLYTREADRHVCMDSTLLPYDSIMHLLVFWYVEKLPKVSQSIEGYPIILAAAVATLAASSLVHNLYE